MHIPLNFTPATVSPFSLRPFFYLDLCFLGQEGASSMTVDGRRFFVLREEVFSSESSKKNLLPMLRGLSLFHSLSHP